MSKTRSSTSTSGSGSGGNGGNGGNGSSISDKKKEEKLGNGISLADSTEENEESVNSDAETCTKSDKSRSKSDKESEKSDNDDEEAPKKNGYSKISSNGSPEVPNPDEESMDVDSNSQDLIRKNGTNSDSIDSNEDSKNEDSQEDSNKDDSKKEDSKNDDVITLDDDDKSGEPNYKKLKLEMKKCFVKVLDISKDSKTKSQFQTCLEQYQHWQKVRPPTPPPPKMPPIPANFDWKSLLVQNGGVNKSNGLANGFPTSKVHQMCELIFDHCGGFVSYRNQMTVPDKDVVRIVMNGLIDMHREDCKRCENNLHANQFPRLGNFKTFSHQRNSNPENFPADIYKEEIINLNEQCNVLRSESEAQALRYEAEIEELQRQISVLKSRHFCNKDEVKKMLKSAPDPKLKDDNCYYIKEGYRMIDINILRKALDRAQECGHGKLMLVELDPSKVYADLVTQLAFICHKCCAETVFPTSAYSTHNPPNYNVNKQVLLTLGPQSYYDLVKFVQKSKESKIVRLKKRNKEDSSLIVLYEKVNDPLDQFSIKTTSGDVDLAADLSIFEPEVILHHVRKAPPLLNRINNVSKPIMLPNTPIPLINRPPMPINMPRIPVRMPPPPPHINKSISGPPLLQMPGSTTLRSIRPCAELPPGARIFGVAPGTRLVSTNVTHSTTFKTGLGAGVYRVVQSNKPERILIIKDGSETGSNVASITALSGGVKPASGPSLTSFGGTRIPPGITLKQASNVVHPPGLPVIKNIAGPIRPVMIPPAPSLMKPPPMEIVEEDPLSIGIDEEDSHHIRDDIAEILNSPDVSSDDSDDGDWGTRKKKKKTPKKKKNW